MTTPISAEIGGAGSSGIWAEMKGPIARICFDRPPVNAFTEGMFADFAAALSGLGADLKPILLTGANGYFSAGFDIKRPDLDGPGPRAAADDCLAAIRDHPSPVVAAVEGAAVGLGLLIAASADILVVSRTARLRMPEVTLGIVSDVGPLRRFLPDPWVRRMCLLGEALTASELQLDGVGAHLCEPGTAEEVARSILESLAEIETSALRRTKRRLAE